ncbi:unnamed protein product [Lactuca virosa]|uniref:Uncharacterized protein n=1 Tax=Lactuca virosa TaxID=75947 RepID=A0AAU9M9E5_9ASTR|nr:unnamed protein product [Lactuca virosa]
MEFEPGGTSGGAIRRTLQQIANEGNTVAKMSPVTRRHNFEETPQITMVVAHRNIAMEVPEEGKRGKERLEEEEREMQEFEAFKNFEAMKKQQVERIIHKVQKERTQKEKDGIKSQCTLVK